MNANPREAGAEEYRDPERFRSEIMERCQPVILRGVASEWPLLAGVGAPEVIARLGEYDAGKSAEVFVGQPEIGARYFYDESLAGFNFERAEMPLSEALVRIVETAAAPGRASMYMGSLPAESYFPGIEQMTRLRFLPETIRPRFWIGHASNVACHYDVMDNVACVAAGRRRFTLFPPDAIGGLYVGPIDHNMAGQPVALAVGSGPNDPRYPRFERVRERALVAELGPGDALYVPKLWWHQVQALDDLNVLVNFWWDGFSSGPDQPYTAMLLAMIAIAERPPAERAAWRAWFDHYVFRPNGHPLDFLPPEQHGVLGALAKGNYGRIRTTIMRLLRGG